MNKRESAIYEFLKHVNVISDEKHYNKLDRVEVLRDIFLSNEKYEECKEHISSLKKIFSSASLTCLQEEAPKKQKWPLLCLVRQILKTNGFEMIPKRKSNGYTINCKKKYIRSYIIKKIVLENKTAV